MKHGAAWRQVFRKAVNYNETKQTTEQNQTKQNEQQDKQFCEQKANAEFPTSLRDQRQRTNRPKRLRARDEKRRTLFRI